MIVGATGDFGIVISDLHVGSSTSLLPPSPVLDDGQTVCPSPIQNILADLWSGFWSVFVPSVTEGRTYWLALLGDTVEGRHHDTSEIVTNNLTDQCKLAAQLVRGIPKLVGQAPTQSFMLRGTPAHDGKAGCLAEIVGESIGAYQAENRFTHRHLILSWRDQYIDLAHHIGISGSPMTECSGLVKEMTKAMVEAGQWSDLCPSLILRGHRHRMSEAAVPTDRGLMRVCTLPGWQMKTEFADKVDPIRRTQIGGIVIGADRFGHLYLRHFLWTPRWGNRYVTQARVVHTGDRCSMLDHLDPHYAADGVREGGHQDRQGAGRRCGRPKRKHSDRRKPAKRRDRVQQSRSVRR